MLSSLINNEKDYLKMEFTKDWVNLIVKSYRKIHKNQIKELALLSKRLYYLDTPVPKYEYDSYFNLGFYYKDKLFVYDDELYLDMRQYYRISLPYLHKDLEKEGWNIFLDQKYKGHIYMYDSERDSFMMALKALGYSMNTDDEVLNI